MITHPTVNHDLIERYARRYANGNMRDEIRITRVMDPVFDEETGSLASGAPLTIYSGIARVYLLSGPVTYSLGDEPQHWTSTNISIPAEVLALPWVEDMIEVTKSGSDQTLVGRFFKVQDVDSGGQWKAVRRMQVIGVQRSVASNYPYVEPRQRPR